MLVDFSPKSGVSSQLQQMLTGNREPQVEVRLEVVDERTCRCSAKNLSSAMAAFLPALSILNFDAVPRLESVGTVLKTARQCGCRPTSIVVARIESPDQMEDLFHLGASDIWLPPLRVVETLGRVAHWLEQAPQEENETVQQHKERLGLRQFVGESPALMAEIQKIPRLARHKGNALIRGETGTGKEI